MSSNGNTMSLKKRGEDVRTLKAINRYVMVNKFAPSVRELMKMLDLSSTSVVDHRLRYLERAGWITHVPNTPRTIVITDLGREVLRAPQKQED